MGKKADFDFQFKKMEDIHKENVIYEILYQLQKNLKPNEIFLSEADFQFSFAQELDRVLKNEYSIDKPTIILEYPIRTCDLYPVTNDFNNYNKDYRDYLQNSMCTACRKKDKLYCGDEEKKECFCNKKRENIDLYFEYEDKDKQSHKCYIEFKYKTLNLKDIKRGSFNNFSLKEHNNVTEQRQDVYKDIERIEHCLKLHKNEENVNGYVIFITNNKSHYVNSNGQKSFNLIEGEKIQKFEFKQKGEKGGIYIDTQEHNKTWNNFKIFTDKNFKPIKNGIFNVLIIHIQNNN